VDGTTITEGITRSVCPALRPISRLANRLEKFPSKLHGSDAGPLSFSKASELLGKYGIETDGRIARIKEEAVAIARQFEAEAQGTRFALKVMSPDIVHKTEEGAYELNVAQRDVKSVFNALMKI